MEATAFSDNGDDGQVRAGVLHELCCLHAFVVACAHMSNDFHASKLRSHGNTVMSWQEKRIQKEQEAEAFLRAQLKEAEEAMQTCIQSAQLASQRANAERKRMRLAAELAQDTEKALKLRENDLREVRFSPAIPPQAPTGPL